MNKHTWNPDLAARLAFSISLLVLLALTSCTSGPAWSPPAVTPAQPAASLPNPASAYCGEQSGKLEIRADEQGNQHGVCVFPDGSECEEWAFFRGECAPGTEEQPQPLTPANLQNAAYPSEWSPSGTVKLADGEYREPIAPGSATELVVRLTEFVAFGDLDGDRIDEAAVVLVTDPGGSGTFYDLVVLVNDGGVARQVASESLGDRVRLESIAIEAGQIIVEMTTHAPDDPMCCPTRDVTRRYALADGELVLLSEMRHPAPDTGQLITLVQSTLTEEYNSYGESGGLSVLPLHVPEGWPRMWAVFSYGGRNYDLDPAPGHLVAIYTWADDAWQELDRMSLTSDDPDVVAPDYVMAHGVTQVDLSPDRVWLEVQGGVGAHSGTYNLLNFDGQTLRMVLSNVSPIPGAGGVAFLGEHDEPAVLLNATDPYVFCYACGVRKISYRVFSWDPAQARLYEVTLSPLPATQAGHPAASLNDRAVVLAQAGLWKEAMAQITEAKRVAAATSEPVDTRTLDWNFTLIKLHADDMAAAVDEGIYPLLENVFYGDYDAAVDLMRAYPPEQLFTPETPLIVGTVADGWLDSVTGHVIESATAALSAKPDLASAYFLRGWAYYLDETTRDLAAADITQAAGMAPNDPLFKAAKQFFDFLADTSSRPPEPVRIRFPAGATSLTLDGQIMAGGADQYVFRALAGQWAMVSVYSAAPGLALEVVDAGGQTLLSAAEGRTSWRDILPSTQDYLVKVVATNGDARYTLDIIIPARIEFAPGAISATVQGQLATQEIDEYVLWAAVGQTMSVSIASPNDDVLLEVYGLQDGQPLVRVPMGQTSWTGMLPGSQDYDVKAVAVGADTAYTMEITIQ